MKYYMDIRKIIFPIEGLLEVVHISFKVGIISVHIVVQEEIIHMVVVGEQVT